MLKRSICFCRSRTHRSAGEPFPSHRRDPSSTPCASPIKSPLKPGLLHFCNRAYSAVAGTFRQNQAATGGGKSGDFVQEMLFRFAPSVPGVPGRPPHPVPNYLLGPAISTSSSKLSCSWRRSAAIRLAEPRSVTRDGRYEVPVQAS